MSQNSCGNCEKEFNIPNVGKSHGICNRHKAAMYADLDKMAQQMGKTPPQRKDNPDNKCIDLKLLTPEEIQLAVKLFALLNKS